MASDTSPALCAFNNTLDNCMVTQPPTKTSSADKMINAVLVFNNNGQPRLTKFYNQLVPLPFPPYPSSTSPLLTPNRTGYRRPATPHLRNLHSRLRPSAQQLQLPASSSAPRLQLLLHRQHPHRQPLARDIPSLRDAVLHPDQYFYRITARAPRFDPGLCRGAGQVV